MSEKEHLDEPMFFSSYLHALDAQCRVALPSEWRRQGAEMAFVLMPARDQALVLLPRPVFAEFVSRTRKLAIANPKIQMAFARIGEMVRSCRCDKQGRMALDREMLNRIGVGQSVRMIGALNHIRLVAPDHWKNGVMERLDEDLDEIRKVSEDAGDLAALLGGLLGKEE